MRILLILPILLFFSYSCEKEVSELQSEYFIKFYGSYLEDGGYDLALTEDGGAVIVGYTTREETGKDVILLAVDKYGNQLNWSPKIFGSDKEDNAYSVKLLSDGYLIAGSTRGKANTGSTTDPDLDAYLIRTDRSGNLIWEKSYETSVLERDNEALNVDLTEDGNYIFVGYSTNTDLSRLVSVVIVDEQGNLLKQSTRGELNEQLSAIHRLDNGNFVVAGTKLNSDKDFFLLRINDDGNDLDNYSFGETDRDDELNCACLGSNNVLFLTGTSYNADRTASSILLMKYDLQTNTILWRKNIQGTGNLKGKSVKETENGNLILVGNHDIAEDENIILYFISPEGNILGSKLYGGAGDQSAEAMSYKNGQILILGKNTYEGNSMITLIKTDQAGNLWE